MSAPSTPLAQMPTASPIVSPIMPSSADSRSASQGDHSLDSRDDGYRDNQEYLLREIEIREADLERLKARLHPELRDESTDDEFVSVSQQSPHPNGKDTDDEWLMTDAERRQEQAWINGTANTPFIKKEPTTVKNEKKEVCVKPEPESPGDCGSVASTSSATSTLSNHFSKRKPVDMLDLKTGEVVHTFPSVRATAAAGYHPQHVTACAKRKRKEHNGFGWQYHSERHRRNAHKKANKRDFGRNAEREAKKQQRVMSSAMPPPARSPAPAPAPAPAPSPAPVRRSARQSVPTEFYNPDQRVFTPGCQRDVTCYGHSVRDGHGALVYPNCECVNRSNAHCLKCYDKGVAINPNLKKCWKCGKTVTGFSF